MPNTNTRFPRTTKDRRAQQTRANKSQNWESRVAAANTLVNTILVNQLIESKTLEVCMTQSCNGCALASRCPMDN